MPADQPFGFAVKQDQIRHRAEPRGPLLAVPGRTGWAVSLPHQCDRWEITSFGIGGVPHDQAITELEAFIAEAQTALAALRNEREFGDPGA